MRGSSEILSDPHNQAISLIQKLLPEKCHCRRNTDQHNVTVAILTPTELPLPETRGEATQVAWRVASVLGLVWSMWTLDHQTLPVLWQWVELYSSRELLDVCVDKKTPQRPKMTQRSLARSESWVVDALSLYGTASSIQTSASIPGNIWQEPQQILEDNGDIKCISGIKHYDGT